MTTIESMATWAERGLPVDAFPGIAVAVQEYSTDLMLHSPQPRNFHCRQQVRAARPGPVFTALAPWLAGRDKSPSDRPRSARNGWTVEVCTGCVYDDEGRPELEDALWVFDQAAHLASTVACLRDALDKPRTHGTWSAIAAGELSRERGYLEFRRRRMDDPPAPFVVSADESTLAIPQLAAWFEENLTVAGQLVTDLTTALRACTGGWDGPRQLITHVAGTPSGRLPSPVRVAVAAADLRRPSLPTFLGPILSIPAQVTVENTRWFTLGEDIPGRDLEVLVAVLSEMYEQLTLTPQSALAAAVALR